MYRKSLFVAVALLTSVAWAQPDAGFESDTIGSEPSAWVVNAADSVVVVGAEGPAEFPIYSELGTTVIPHRGSQMLRMGTPKQVNETQNRGMNSISQTFPAEGGSVRLALRLFSLEHRGDDTLIVDLEDSVTGQSFAISASDGGAFGIDVPQGPDPSCASTPCELVIDVGKRQNRLDSGWQVLTISGLPDDGRMLTLTVGVAGGQNEALASWLYVDDVNAEPLAVMQFNPGSIPGTVTQESDFVVFDCLGSNDPDGDELTCSWTADGPGVPETTIEGPTVVFSFPDDGAASVTLTVSDGEASDSTTTGDGRSPALTIVNGDPLVNALNVEVLPGDDVQLLCRFADPGANDQHTVTISVGSPLANDAFAEENVAAISSGFATARFDATGLTPGNYQGQCDVSDDDGGFGSDSFVVTVVDPVEFVSRNQANPGSTLSAPVQVTDASFAGALTAPGQIMVYELRQPDGSGFPVGAEINISVEVPVDYDAVLLNGNIESNAEVAPWVSAPWVSAPWVSAPFVSVPFVSAPFVSAPFVSAPFVSVPFVSAPWVSAPWVSAPWVSAPIRTSPWVSANYEFSDFPLSQVGLAAPDGSNISGIDVAFEDLGAENSGKLANEPVRVKGLSAEFGTTTERLLGRIGPGEAGQFLAIIPQAGAFTTAPFSVQLEASIPPPQSEVLGESCLGAPLVPNGTSVADVLVSNGQPKSLIVTQKERLMATFDMTESDFTEWLNDLLPYFNHPKVAAKVISVPSTWYDDADTNPCVVSEQNAVATRIRGLIQGELSTSPIEYIQLMGSLDIVPAYFVPDETQTGYEGLFLQDLWVRPGTPLSVAVAEGNNITDAFYGDSEPQPYRGRSLYTEDISVSRMVERPNEILASAQRFVANDGLINLTSTQATGYDFFIDGTLEIERILASLPVPSSILNDDTWTADALRCQFFGQGEGCAVSELNAVNAHFSYNGAISADGFINNTPNEVVGSLESAGLLNGVTFSIGCHSGLSVPDAWALPDNVGLPLNPARDWVQELGNWVGSYNFAYGDSVVADRGTEGIIPLVIENFTAGETLGKALIKAKWRYGAGLYEFGVYDEKSMISLGLFGMPQATIAVTAPAQPPTANAVSSAAQPAGTFQLDVLEEGTTTSYSATIEEQANADGAWFTLDGNAQAILGRPLHPVIIPRELRPVPAGDTSVHGAVIRGGRYTELLERDPVFPVQVHDFIQSFSEPNPCVETMAPSQIASVTRFDSPEATLQSVIVQAGQFECTLDPVDQGVLAVEGTFRIWSDVELELTKPLQLSQDVDFEPPVVIQQEIVANPVTMDVTATLDATDNLGMREIVALIFEDLDGEPGGDGRVIEVTTGNIVGVPGPHTLVLPAALDKKLAFQYVDVAGNMLAKTLKGSLLRAVGIEIVTSIFEGGGSTSIVIEISDFALLAAPYLNVDFGDGSTPLILELTNPDGTPVAGVEVDADGKATVIVEHDYSDFAGSSVEVVAEIRAPGARGTDRAILLACGDPEGDALIADGDIVGCSISSAGAEISIDVVVAGIISDGVQYRLRLLDTNNQIKYSAGDVTGPKRLKPSAALVGPNRLRFTFDASRAGWDGGEFGFSLSTQEGVASGQSAGIVDETDEFSFEP